MARDISRFFKKSTATAPPPTPSNEVNHAQAAQSAQVPQPQVSPPSTEDRRGSKRNHETSNEAQGTKPITFDYSTDAASIVISISSHSLMITGSQQSGSTSPLRRVTHLVKRIIPLSPMRKSPSQSPNRQRLQSKSPDPKKHRSSSPHLGNAFITTSNNQGMDDVLSPMMTGMLMISSEESREGRSLFTSQDHDESLAHDSDNLHLKLGSATSGKSDSNTVQPYSSSATDPTMDTTTKTPMPFSVPSTGAASGHVATMDSTPDAAQVINPISNEAMSGESNTGMFIHFTHNELKYILLMSSPLWCHLQMPY